MIKFSKEKVMLLHKMLGEETGGSIGLRDEGLLDSALESAYASFDGVDFFPSKEEKAAKICFSLISNHTFVDGNKRIGMYVMLTFLEINGIPMNCTNDEVSSVGLSIASGEMDYNQILEWILNHETKTSNS